VSLRIGSGRRPATIGLGIAIVIAAAIGAIWASQGPATPATAPGSLAPSGASAAAATGATPRAQPASTAGSSNISLPPASPAGPASQGPGAPGPPPTATPSPAGVASSAPAVLAVVDPTLLTILPATVGGATLAAFPSAAQQAATDPDLGRNVSRLATAFVGDPAGANWAYTAIVDVRPEARSEAFYRDWQESFDQSACDRAGGVTGHTTTVIAGHTVERTACGQGVRTYHVRITGTGLLVSISALGTAGFGELEIAALP
jgi:hypothetical protein